MVALPTARIYCSPFVTAKLLALIAEDTAVAQLKIAQLHGVTLGLALDCESTSALRVVRAQSELVVFESDETPYVYSCELRDGGLRINRITRHEPFGASRSIRVVYEGEPRPKPIARMPKPKKLERPPIFRPPAYDETTNSWLDALELAPALTRRYARNGFPTTLRDELLKVVSSGGTMGDLFWEEFNAWLGVKGIVLFKPKGSDKFAIVGFYPEVPGYRLGAVLTKARGHAAIDEMMAFAGGAARVAPNGTRLAWFNLHLAC